jgi:hypothetical protein
VGVLIGDVPFPSRRQRGQGGIRGRLAPASVALGMATTFGHCGHVRGLSSSLWFPSVSTPFTVAQATLRHPRRD